MNTYFWINIYCIKYLIKASNSVLDDWEKSMSYTQNLFNKSSQNFKLRTKGIRRFSIQFVEKNEAKTSLPHNPLGDTAWIHYRYIDEAIMKNSPSLNQKMEFIAHEAYKSLELLCIQKGISIDTFKDSFQCVKENLPKQ